MKDKKTTNKEEKKLNERSVKEVVVTYHNGTRTFSKEVHGSKFEKLAEEFAKKFNGVVH